MIKTKVVIFLSLLFTFSLFGEEIGLLAGSNSGTYIKIANDIKGVSKNEMKIDVKTGGSLGNINKLLTDKSSQFAIVQYDALLYKRDIEGDAKLDSKIKMLFPLYNEEIHIIVSKSSNINSIHDLEGKRVNTDAKSSGSWVTAEMIKSIHALTWKEYNLQPRDALIKLAENKLDAMIYVVGKPAPILVALPKESKDTIKLISPELDDYYVSTQFEKETYPWMEGEVKTNATKALLITYNYKTDSKVKRVQYYIKNIRKLASVINNSLGELRENHHPKWKEIDPKDYDKVKWPLHPVARTALFEKNIEMTSSQKKMLEALKRTNK